jgi:hypothetical protein
MIVLRKFVAVAGFQDGPQITPASGRKSNELDFTDRLQNKKSPAAKSLQGFSFSRIFTGPL